MDDQWAYAARADRMPKTSTMSSTLVTAQDYALDLTTTPQELIFFSEIMYTLKMETVQTSDT